MPVHQPRRDRDVESAAIGQCQALVRSRDRLGKVDRQAVVQVASAPVRACSLAAPQQFGKRVVGIHEIGVTGRVGIRLPLIAGGEIPVVLMLRPLRTRCVDLAGVEALAFLGVAEQIVRAGDFLKLLFRRLVPRIKVRMQFLRELPICLPDICCRGR